MRQVGVILLSPFATYFYHFTFSGFPFILIFVFIKWLLQLIDYKTTKTDTFKYHVFAPMVRFQLELIYLYFPQSFHV